ncbi:helix-turn-helix domain-containing protein [Aliiglaciecola sp. LCG003]|uniref:helix-turn-helix domain-containing protein n=1 Tax=Aliiglaciecola sp. LCG003 TaxID=3053655 RepID=UPI002573FB81|nr:helix-turn-helix domain-containing protein [Aliiglaciecola sp. LCG003]WJG09430.1 helix-turn-helix domain-containing protein [Aliiglaciecola sp. LCG003]
MSQVQTVILAIGGLQGFLLFTLLVSDKRVNYASKLLGLQCLFIATTFLLPLIVAGGDSKFTWLIGFLVFLPACYGALTYLYCRAAITGLPLKYSDTVHLLPLAICYLLNYDILFSPEKALNFVRMADITLFRHTLTKAIFYGQVVVYTALLMRMVSYYQTNAKQTHSSYNPDIFKWLWSLIAFIVSIWALKVVFYFIYRSPILDILADCLLAVMVYFIAIVQWRNPSLFQIQQITTQQEQPTPAASKHLSDGLLDQDTRAEILRSTQHQVKQQALYRNSELTLATLADKVGVSVHHLSETLNQHGGKNFNQFINEYRVAEVCQQLDQKSDQKLIDLALAAGFSSKSSFNAIFKKLTGQTPSLYRRQ